MNKHVRPTSFKEIVIGFAVFVIFFTTALVIGITLVYFIVLS